MLSLLLSACAAMQRGVVAPDLVSEAQPMRLPAVLWPLLEQQPEGARFKVSETPWGTDVVVALQNTYSAASGRTCRRFIIDPEDRSIPGLACRLADGSWTESRVLQDNGRPLLESKS